MKQSAKLILLALVLWGAHLAKAQWEEGDVGSADSTEFDEQKNQPLDGIRVGRMIGAIPATSANYLYGVFVIADSDLTQTLLVGAIISNTQVLTSASGLLSAGNITKLLVVADTYNERNFFTKSYELHSGFNLTTLANDVAIITINGTFAGVPDVQPIAISTSEIAVSATNRTVCVVLGYGQDEKGIYNGILSQADYELLTDQECTTAFNQTLPSSILCARSVKGYACDVDGGAPLVCNDQLYGILTDQTSCSISKPWTPQKFAKLPVIRIPRNTPTILTSNATTAPRKNYVSCP